MIVVAAQDLGLLSKLIVNAKVILHCLFSVELLLMGMVNEKQSFLTVMYLSSRHLVSCPDPTRTLVIVSVIGNNINHIHDQIREYL